MNLHRTTGKPDWHTVKKSDYNAFQKIAAVTYGFVTPANIITIIGLGLVIYGLVEILNQHFWTGFIAVVIGRLLDIADGMVAQATHTKSPIGEIFDAVADKIGTLLTIAVLFIAAIASWWVITLLLVPQVLIPLVVFYKRQKGISVHPTRQGKLSMAISWVAIAGLIITKALNSSPALEIISYGLIALAVALGIYALWQYATGRDQRVES